MKCDGCGKALVGQYLEALGRRWHKSCLTCAACGLALGSDPFVVQEGKPYHQACHLKLAPRCKGCGKPIAGTRLAALGHHWHPECLLCRGCGKPIAEPKFAVSEGVAWHEACLRKQVAESAPKCAICSKPLLGNYSRDYWNNCFHSAHSDEYVSCFSCSRLICEPLTKGGQKYDSRRSQCRLCLARAVRDASQVRSLLAVVLQQLEALGLKFKETPLVRLVADDEMRRLSGAIDPLRPTAGLTRSQVLSRNGKLEKRSLEDILILKDLPDDHFSDVLAHELTHAWLALEQFPLLKPKQEEGICVLVQALRLGRLRDEGSKFRLQQIEADRHPLYGEGYREAKASLGSSALLKWLRQVQTAGKYPGLMARIFS